jgi:hypothetical protein
MNLAERLGSSGIVEAGAVLTTLLVSVGRAALLQMTVEVPCGGRSALRSAQGLYPFRQLAADGIRLRARRQLRMSGRLCLRAKPPVTW